MSSSTTAKKVTARTKARQKIAAQREEQARRQKADEADLAEILKALDSQDGAAVKRSDAIAMAKVHYDNAVEKAHADYGEAVADSEALIGQRLAAMRGRGQSVGDLAELTELSETDIRRHVKAHKDRTSESAPAADTSAGSTTDGQDVAEDGSDGAVASEALGGTEDRAVLDPEAELSVAAG